MLNLLDPLVEVVHEVLLLCVSDLLLALVLKLCICLADLLLELLDLLFVFVDDFLAEVGSFCELFFYLLMVNKIFLKVSDDVLHFVVLLNQVLSLS